MKLSDVMYYMELLDNYQLQTDFADTSRHLDSIVYTIQNYSTQLDNFSQEIESASNDVRQSFSQVDNVLSNMKLVLERIRLSNEPEMLNNSYLLWEQGMGFEPTDYILNRRLAIDPKDFDVFYGHLLTYTDWRVPGMIIRPGLEKWIEHLVPLDPLYVVDTDAELIQPSVNKFTVEYQRRLRTYVINDMRRTSILGDLPDNQFGFVFAYNYFNFKPMEVIKRYLKEIFLKLRSGGIFMFTYNDCDWAHGTALAEKNFMCYTPGSSIVHEATMQGFEVVYQHRGLGNVSWLELKRPGDIKSLRGGQTLAQIKIDPEIQELRTLQNFVNECISNVPAKVDNLTIDELKEIIIQNGYKDMLKKLANSQ